MTRAAVLGAGSWGTAFAKIMADTSCDVTVWARRPAVAAAIREQRTNPDTHGLQLLQNFAAWDGRW